MEGLENSNLQKFDPTVAELTAMVETTKDITVTDLTDPAQLKVVKENRIALSKARIKIEKIGKELRADALKFQKDVIAKEKELISIIGPEEDRLSAIEDEAKKLEIRKQRLEILPVRKDRLLALADGVEVEDDYLLSLDPSEFEGYINKRMADKNQKAADELKAREDKIKEDERRIENEKITRDREEKARIEERERLEREQKDKEARELKAKQDADRKEAEEKAKLEQQEKYRAYRASLGWTEENKAEFKEEKNGNVVTIWKKVGEFEI